LLLKSARIGSRCECIKIVGVVRSGVVPFHR